MANPRVSQRSALGTGIGPTGLGGMQGGVGGAQDATHGLFAAPPLTKLGINFSQASTWAWIWFGLAVFYLAFMYGAHGGRKGGIV